jgi:DNA processing protein
VSAVAAAADKLALASVALSRLLEPGHQVLAGWIRSLGAEACWRAAAAASDGRSAAGSIPPPVAEGLRRHPAGMLLRAAQRDLEAAARCGARVIVPGDPEWPAVALDGLWQLDDPADPYTAPPLCLWLRGPARLDQVRRRSVAVVGARAATPYGEHVATELGFGLAERSWTVVSGGAYGVDSAAHRGALAAAGVTVAVLANGVDQAYPRGHGALFEQIAASGLLVSELPPGTQPRRRRFLVRNRLIAAIATGTVVVEAAARSGARMTARRADELGRVVGAVPGPVTSALSVGCHHLIRSAGAVLVSTVDEVIDLVGELGVDAVEAPRAAEAPIDTLVPDAARVLDAVPVRRFLAADRIAVLAGLPAVEVYRQLPGLVAIGLVEETGGRYRLGCDAPQRLARPAAEPPRLR